MFELLTTIIKFIQFATNYCWYIFKFSLLRLAWLFLFQTEWTSQWGNFESRTEIQQTPPTILPEEVRIDRQNPKFLGNNICQPPARYIANSPLFPYIQCFLAYNVRLLQFWVFSRNVTRRTLPQKPASNANTAFCHRVHFISFLALAFVDHRNILITRIPWQFSSCILDDKFHTFHKWSAPWKKTELLVVCFLASVLKNGPRIWLKCVAFQIVCSVNRLYFMSMT